MKLSSLELTTGDFNVITPTIIKKLPNLTYLDLGYNQLTSVRVAFKPYKVVPVQQPPEDVSLPQAKKAHGVAPRAGTRSNPTARRSPRLSR